MSTQPPKKHRIVKDLIFLLSMPTLKLQQGLSKRIQAQGTGPSISSISLPCDVYLSYDKYSYEGRLLDSIHKIRARNQVMCHSETLPMAVQKGLLSMRVNERAWLNAQGEDLHHMKGLVGGGCHYHITIEEIKYKNGDSYESKVLVAERCNQEGGELFDMHEYHEAGKKYLTIINIIQCFHKKQIKDKAQLKHLAEISLKAKENYLKCLFKYKKVEQSLLQKVDAYSKEIIANEVTDDTLYLRGLAQMHTKYLTDALETAKKLMGTSPDYGKRLWRMTKARLDRIAGK